MKHLQRITNGLPARGALWHDVVCVATSAKNGIITALGGSLPIADAIDAKCSFEAPADSSQDSGATQ